MPVQPKRICTYPGCNNLVLAARCAAHPYPQRRTRGTSSAYGANWKAIRTKLLERRPVCEYRFKCEGAPATEVDHRDNNNRNNAVENLVPTCKRCHAHKTATVDRKRDSGGKFDVY